MRAGAARKRDGRAPSIERAGPAGELRSRVGARLQRAHRARRRWQHRPPSTGTAAPGGDQDSLPGVADRPRAGHTGRARGRSPARGRPARARCPSRRRCSSRRPRPTSTRRCRFWKRRPDRRPCQQMPSVPALRRRDRGHLERSDARGGRGQRGRRRGGAPVRSRPPALALLNRRSRASRARRTWPVPRRRGRGSPSPEKAAVAGPATPDVSRRFRAASRAYPTLNRRRGTGVVVALIVLVGAAGAVIWKLRPGSAVPAHPVTTLGRHDRARSAAGRRSRRRPPRHRRPSPPPAAPAAPPRSPQRPPAEKPAPEKPAAEERAPSHHSSRHKAREEASSGRVPPARPRQRPTRSRRGESGRQPNPPRTSRPPTNRPRPRPQRPRRKPNPPPRS